MRSPEALKPRETHRTPNWPGAELSMETIRAYLADLSGRGRRKGTVQMYSAKLRALYDYLPPDKQISRGTLAAWRAFLLEAGYSPSTVNTHLSAANGLMRGAAVRPVARLSAGGAAGLRPAAGPDGGAGVLHPERERHEPDPGDGGDPDPVS